MKWQVVREVIREKYVIYVTIYMYMFMYHIPQRPDDIILQHNIVKIRRILGASTTFRYIYIHRVEFGLTGLFQLVNGYRSRQWSQFITEASQTGHSRM